jgi:aminopeptidase YwaD
VKTGTNILGIKEAELKTIETLTVMKKDTTAKVKVSFRDLSPTVSFKVNFVKKQTDAYNVIGILEGNDAALKTEAIVIGAHYDHLGKGGQGSRAEGSTEIHHGADDNASGTAALLELARRFAKEKNNKRTLIFVAFGGEEEGLLGSKSYVDNPVFPLEKTVAMLNMDMVGRLSENKLTVGGIGTANEWKDLVNSKNLTESGVATLTGLSNVPPVKVKNPSANAAKFSLQLNEEGFGPSDHSSFYGKQIPVLFFFTGTHGDYHKPSDTADKINYKGLAEITGYIGAIVNSIDQNPAKPAYRVTQSSSTGGRTGFNVTIGVVPGYGESTDGMLLDNVRDGSPAALAGLKAGDKVVKFAGKEIRNVQDYTFVLGELKADTEYEIEVVRGAQRLILKVKPAARK